MILGREPADSFILCKLPNCADHTLAQSSLGFLSILNALPGRLQLLVWLSYSIPITKIIVIIESTLRKLNILRGDRKHQNSGNQNEHELNFEK